MPGPASPGMPATAAVPLRWRVAFALCAVLVLAAAVLLVVGLTSDGSTDDAKQQDQVQQATDQGMRAVLSVSPATAEADIDRGLSFLTDPLLGRLKGSRDQTLAAAKKGGSSSVLTSQVAIESVTGDKAVALYLGTLTLTPTPAPRAPAQPGAAAAAGATQNVLKATIDLQRIDGRWLVADIQPVQSPAPR